MREARRSFGSAGRAALLALAILGAAWVSPARADHGSSYRGHYANAFMAGRTADGREVAVMAGVHTDFPYHDPGSNYDQIAVQVGAADPVIVTGHPKLPGFDLELGDRAVRFSYARARLRLALELASVRHTSRYEGDPGRLGDLFIQAGVESSESPGFVYTPYELTGLARGTLVVGGETIELASLHGQAEAGRIEAPTDRRFRTAYDYLAAPTSHFARGVPFTYVGFLTHALHAGTDAAFDAYFRETGSDEFTMEAGSLADGNTRSVPSPFDNTGSPPPGGRKLSQWAVDLGPGILYRKLVRLAGGGGRPVLALSETIKEDTGEPDRAAPVITGARAGPKEASFRLSEHALVTLRRSDRRRVIRLDGRAGRNAIPLGALRSGRTRLTLRATDQVGNRSRPVRLSLTR